MQKRVLFIDDDRVPSGFYASALQEEGLIVERSFDIDHAWTLVDCDKLDVVVLDIMMPGGTRYSDHQTRDGLLTGLFFEDDLEEKCPELPIIALTNVTNGSTLKQMGARHSVVSVKLKPESPPDEFAIYVRNFLAEASAVSGD